MGDESGKEGFEILGVNTRWVLEFLLRTALEDQGMSVCGEYGEEEEEGEEGEEEEDEEEEKWRVGKWRSHFRGEMKGKFRSRKNGWRREFHDQEEI